MKVNLPQNFLLIGLLHGALTPTAVIAEHCFGGGINEAPGTCGEDSLKCPAWRNLARQSLPSDGCPVSDLYFRKYGNCLSDRDCYVGSYCCLSICEGISRCYNPYINKFTDHLHNYTGSSPCMVTQAPCGLPPPTSPSTSTTTATTTTTTTTKPVMLTIMSTTEEVLSTTSPITEFTTLVLNEPPTTTTTPLPTPSTSKTTTRATTTTTTTKPPTTTSTPTTTGPTTTAKTTTRTTTFNPRGEGTYDYGEIIENSQNGSLPIKEEAAG